MSNYGVNGMTAELGQYETPFADIPVTKEADRESEAKSDMYSNYLMEVDSPFSRTFETASANSSVTPAGEEFVQFIGELNNEEFNNAVYELAAEMEDKTEKHPVTPCEVIPARELLGDMLLEMNKPDQALIVYETDLEKHPNRLNGLYGAGVSASKSGNPEKAALYFKQLSGNMNPDDSDNPMLIKIKSYLAMASSK